MGVYNPPTGGGGGSGTVTDVSVVTANGVSGSVATSTTTPAITLTLGAITPSTVNGNTVTTGTGTLTLSTFTLTASGNGSVSGSNTGDQTNISGNAATVTTNANLTGHVTSVGNAAVLGSFTSAQLATALTDETGSGKAVFDTSPTFNTGVTFNAAPITISGNISSAAWTTSGIRIKGAPGTLTDTSSSGTVATAYTDVLGGNTIAASSSTTFTDYFTTFMKDPVQGSNVTLTNKWSLGLEGKIKSAGALFTGSATSTLGTITADTPGFTGTATWNSGGVTFNGIKYNVTNTASAAASQLLDLQVAGASRLSVAPGNTGTLLSVVESGGATVFAVNDTGTEGDIVLSKASGNGIRVDTTTPTFGWRDMLGYIHTRTGGATVPTFAAYQGGIYQFEFDAAANVQEVFNEYHMPHDYLPSSDLFIHTHWSTIVTATGNVNWLFDLSYAKGYDQSVFEGTAGTALPVTCSITQAGAAAFKHEIAEIQCSAAGGLINPAVVNVSITSGTPDLTSASALFTAADEGRTIQVIGAGAAAAVLNATVLTFVSTTAVTLDTNASTTVTAQNNFRYRVLDTSLLEIDGLILVRTWHKTNRTADTLTQIPFLHFVDVHYQSTNMATKQRNGPGFYT